METWRIAVLVVIFFGETRKGIEITLSEEIIILKYKYQTFRGIL